MEWNKDYLYLEDKDIKVIATYLAYGTTIGVILGLLIGNIPLLFSLCSVIGIIIATIQNLITKAYSQKYKK